MNNNVNHLDLKVGWECDNFCIHCVVSDKARITSKHRFTTEEIKGIVDKNMDSEKITLTGGEPTIRKDFIDIIKYIKEVLPNKMLTLQTNGRQFKDINFTKEVLKYVDNCVVALHSCDEQVHDKITGVKGSWAETNNGLKNILKIDRYKLQTMTVISRLNMPTLCNTFDYLYKELDVASSMLTFPHANGRAWHNFNIVVPKFSEIKNIIDYITVEYPQVIPSAIPPCYLLKNEENIARVLYEYQTPEDVDAKTVCVELTAPNRTEDFSDLIKADFSKVAACSKCIFDDKCLGVWKEYVWKYKNEMDLIPVILA